MPWPANVNLPPLMVGMLREPLLITIPSARASDGKIKRAKRMSAGRILKKDRMR
jgi:hypothetical protein